MAKQSNAQITDLVRSMKKALKNQHGIDVPHTALRASLLSAHGENPHAFAKKEGPKAPEARQAGAERASIEDLLQEYTYCVTDEAKGRGTSDKTEAAWNAVVQAASAAAPSHAEARLRKLLTQLVEWGEQTGGWEAPVWAEARREVGASEPELPEGVPRTIQVAFEYVYADESGDWVPATLDLLTGIVTPDADLPDDIDEADRERIWINDYDGEPIDEEGVGTDVDIYFDTRAQVWRVYDQDLETARQLAATSASLKSKAAAQNPSA